MTQWTFEDVAEQGRRADAAELALLALMKSIEDEADGYEPSEEAQAIGQLTCRKEYQAALKLLRGSKLRVIQEGLAKLEKKPPPLKIPRESAGLKV